MNPNNLKPIDSVKPQSKTINGDETFEDFIRQIQLNAYKAAMTAAAAIARPVFAARLVHC